jgi:hypothetical protein
MKLLFLPPKLFVTYWHVHREAEASGVLLPSMARQNQILAHHSVKEVITGTLTWHQARISERLELIYIT